MNMDKWPKHPDGRNKKIGEMTSDEARQVTKDACGRLMEEFANPLVREKIQAILEDKRVDH
jgi:hypothetical protein